jgi:hypothetical protein
MSIDFIIGMLTGASVVLIIIVAIKWYWELYTDVYNLRQERRELLERTKELTVHFYKTQEEVNSYYEWKKERNKG